MFRIHRGAAVTHGDIRELPGKLGPGRRYARSPWIVAGIVLLVYGWWIASAFRAGHDARDFIFIGRSLVEKSHVSSVIKVDPSYHYFSNNVGYDGQFSYYIALDPVNARYYLDTGGPAAAGPDYRYTRILYPMLARLLALGRSGLIPYTLLLINWLALAGGTLAVAAWLGRKGISPWFALIYGLYPGLLVALQRDLTEALAYALVALAVYLYDYAGRWSALLAGVCFALAALTRETTAVFPLVYGTAVLLTNTGPGGAQAPPVQARLASNWRRASLLLAVSLLPLLLYKGFLWFWLGSFGRTGGLYPQPVPFGGILTYWPWKVDQIEEVIGVIVPVLICTGVGLWAVWKRMWQAQVWALLANSLLFVVLLNSKSYVEYFASGRVAAGVVLAALYCLPVFDRLTGGNRWWIWISSWFWLLLLPALYPYSRRRLVPSDLILDAAVLLALWLLTRLTETPRLPSRERLPSPALRGRG